VVTSFVNRPGSDTSSSLAEALEIQPDGRIVFRILEIRTEIADELLDAGFNGIFVVEPAVCTTPLKRSSASTNVAHAGCHARSVTTRVTTQHLEHVASGHGQT
jgi:hypothetical protein